MAPRRTPRKERGPGNYTALGREGRRTGVTLKDTGVRDENGLEPIPSFSSPAKSLHQPNGVALDATYSADDSMDIDQSTIPEPAELLQSNRKVRPSLPPRATSPIKTHLNSSPRRSMPRSVGPMPSPSRSLDNGTPTRATSHPPLAKPVNRRLDFSPEKPSERIEKSSLKASSSKQKTKNTASTSGRGAGKGKGKRVFDLTEGGNDSEVSETEASLEPNGASEIVPDDESMMLNGGDQFMMDSVLDQGSLGEDYTEDQPQSFPEEDSQLMGPPATSGAKESKNEPGRRPTATIVIPDASQMSAPEPQQKPRGRPRGSKKTQVFQDPDVSLAPPASPKDRGRRNPPPSLRDPNIPSKVSKGSRGKPASRAPSTASTSRFIQRSETPANDSGTLITRYGRQSIKPLASWRGEKTIMGHRTFDSLPGIKEVLRVDEVIEPRPKQKPYYRRHRTAKSRLADVEEEEEAEEEEERASWEIDPGIMMAQVMDWDPNTNKYDEGSTRNEDVAYSHEAIEMRDINGSEFKFAKTLTLDFFGSGMVQLPPGGFKRIKNSRKMQMVFFVFYGRVTVNIGTPPTKFSIGKGGQWQVPRGNFYSITNESTTSDARIFFAQGCEIQAGAMDDSTMA